MSRVLVVGGGASGMVAAIRAARNGHSVTILEHNDKLGKKIYATGNGKCNLTNRAFPDGCYRGGSEAFVSEVLQAFSAEDTLRFFEELGLMIKERRGYCYPMSEQAASVVSVLTSELTRLRVRVLLGCEVTEIRKEGSGFVLSYQTAEPGVMRANADAVILACGGLAGQNLGAGEGGYRFARAFGHKVIPTFPALVPLCAKEKWLRSVSGVRLDTRIMLKTVVESDVSLQDAPTAVREQGEMVFTDYGISGIPVMQLSRYAGAWWSAGRHVEAVIDFLPEVGAEALYKELNRRRTEECFSSRTAEEAFCGILPKKLMYHVIQCAGIAAEMPVGIVREKQIERLVTSIKAFSIALSGSRSFEFAQVTAGGVCVEEVNPKTCESRLVPGLYFTGELLDVDGTCGGYNLQWAWSTGMIAGGNVHTI